MKRINFDARKLMEKAVEVMRESVPEPRMDGKASPKVGAVLWKLDGTIDTAYRGELRHGDHAEYTLLERKNRNNKLDGAILFATLEPCAPNARRHPKLGCAERIVLARISEVWIGIEDPDPTVDRKGIKYLQEAGITVHMFDRDLQESIQEANKEFLAKAMERAEAASEAAVKPVTLSNLEEPLDANVNDFSIEALDVYRRIAKVEDEVGSFAFNRRLARLGLLRQEGEQFMATGYGLLLFDKEPRTAMPQAGLLGTIHYPDGTEEIQNFEGPQVLVPDQALQWLRDKLPNPIDRSEARRREANEALFDLMREGITNALVHRDYSIVGGKCQLVVTSDKIVVMSPGMPVKPITLEQMQSFSAPMLSRNPVLHYVFAQMEMAEERGLGLKSMRSRATQASLPLPKYTWEDPYLVLTLFRSAEAAVNTLRQTALETLSNAERKGWQWVAAQGTVTSNAYAEALGVPNRTALNHLKRFTDLGLLRRLGTGPSTRYDVI